MVPESLATLYAFLGLVAPGVTFQLVTERTRPAREESAFREATVVAISSLVFTSLSVLVLAAVSRLKPESFVDLAAWLSEGDEYTAAHLWLVATSVGLEVLLATGLAALTAWLFSKLPSASTTPIVKTGVWYQALKGDKPKDKASWVAAELVNGTRVWGYVHFFTIEDRGDDRDISFKGPGLAIQPAGATDSANEDYYEYFVVRASQISILKVAHEAKRRG